MIECGRKTPIQNSHYMMGHTGRHLINPTRKYLGILTATKLNPREHCARGRIRQANIPRVSKGQHANNSRETTFIDISSMMYPSL